MDGDYDTALGRLNFVLHFHGFDHQYRVTGVDRSPAMVELARQKLAGRHAVFLTGDAAHPPVDGERYDAVLTDVVMPGMSGVELAERVRQQHAGTGVVLVTGYSERAVQLPGVRALAKPPLASGKGVPAPA